MNPSLMEFREKLRELLLNFLWRQWTSLGAAGNTRSENRGIIDPEALLLFTCTLGRHDPRLFDEAIDWLQQNGSFINILRLKRISGAEDFAGGSVLAALAGLMSRGSEVLKWKKLALSAQTNHSPEELFFAKDMRALPTIGEPDPCFLRYGFKRGRLRPRGYSRSFRPAGQMNLFLQLRALFGINIRCEIILYLLTHESAHPSKIARDVYCFGRAVQSALVDMNRSGVVQLRRSGREKHYWIKAEHWMRLLNREERLPEWISWPPLFSALETIWLKINEPILLTLDPLLQSSEVRQLMLQVRPRIERSGFDKALSDDRQYQGEAYLPVFLSDITKLVGEGGNS